MKNLTILKEKETKEILEKLEEQFGIKEIPGILIKIGSERIFLFRGEATLREIGEIDKTAFIERAGVYIGKIFTPTDEIRLSIEGTQIFREQITKNIFTLENEEDYEKWMNGQELNIKTGMKGFLIIKYKDDYLGAGKASEEKIGNFIPKNRRLKIKN